MRRECRAEISVNATAEAIWAVVSDVTRVGEWSGECRGCTWVTGSDRVAPGARFRGRNRRGGFRWTRLNEIVAANRPTELVWRTIPTGPYPDSVEWRITLVSDQLGTRVSESFRILRIPRPMEWLVGLAIPAHRDRTADLSRDLVRLKSLVEVSVDQGSPRTG
jgi:hypothetical protein